MRELGRKRRGKYEIKVWNMRELGRKRRGKSERQGREEEMRRDKYEKRGTDNKDKEKYG